MLGLHDGSVVSADTLVELLWGDDPPRTADKALQTHISSLRRTLGDGVVLTEGSGWSLAAADIDAARYTLTARMGRDAAAAGDTGQAVARFEQALALWRGVPELPDTQRGASEKTRWVEGHAALVEDRADALLATGRAAEIIGELEGAVAEAPLRERRWGQLMLALYRAGRQGEALGAFQRARSLLVDQLGVDPSPELRRLETAIVAQDSSLDTPVAQHLPAITRAVTFFLTDIEGSTAAWEADANAMAVALARHDELVEQVVTSRGGRLIKTRGEGDATFSVFDRPSAAAAAAIELQDAIAHEPWASRDPMRIRVALHTGEAEVRDGDYFGRAVNRAARLRSLAAGGQILCSGATAELVIDSLPEDVMLLDLGMRQLKNLARPEHVFELRLDTAEATADEPTSGPSLERPPLPTVLAGPGPFVGRRAELERLLSAWHSSLAGATQAVLIAGEPGVGKTRLAGEWAQHAYEQGAVVLYGRCDEDLGAPYQPFAEALRSLVPCLGANRLRGLRGVESLLALVPGLTDVLPDLATTTRADPDTERYALFDAVVALLEISSASAPIVLILDDLHWAAKPTLLLLRHLLRFGEHARVQIVGTYRSTDLDRSHPLAAMLADLHRDGSINRITLGGLDEEDVTAYVAEAGYDDEELARALASVTGGNPFFLIEALRHVDESGGRWDPSTLPQGVREAVSRRLSRLPAETNKALAAAAVVGSRFALELVEQVVEQDLIDAFDEARKAGIVIEEPGGYYRFNHALVRQSLLAELASVRRMRLHQRIATTLENSSGTDDELLAELAYHYFECAWAGNAAKAVEYCRRAADQAMARLGYEGAAELYDRALHALEEIDEELPDRDDQTAELLIARCEALLAAGDVASAVGAVSQLQQAAPDSPRLAAWATCFDGQLSMLIHPERLDEVEVAVGAAADKLAGLDDAAGEALAHTVRAGCLARLGRVGDCEIALDNALTAARRAREHRRVNAVLAGAPLAALWGPNPVPRAGGRCLDVVRLLRITTDSPAVEATSTRCQAVLEAFRGRAAAAQRMIGSARRTVTELGLRHALLEVEQFAGIVELVGDNPAAAEPHLRQAYKGFRRMGLDADTAETAALLARACLMLERVAEADELCSESERLAGHALKPLIAWRTVRAQLLARQGEHDEARRIAEAAVGLAERTDLLVDHGDACLALATVLGAAGDLRGARVAAERAVTLYETKGAAALADKARQLLGAAPPAAPAVPETTGPEPESKCVHAIRRLDAAVARGAWDDAERQLAPEVSVEVRRKVVGVPRVVMSAHDWVGEVRHLAEAGVVRHKNRVLAVRGERLALTRSEMGTEDQSPGAAQVEVLRLFGLDTEGRVASHVTFDVEDMQSALAELEATQARFEAQRSQTLLGNACVRAVNQMVDACDRESWGEVENLFASDVVVESHRKLARWTPVDLSPQNWPQQVRRVREMGALRHRQRIVAVRGERLALVELEVGTEDLDSGAPRDKLLELYGLNEAGQIALHVFFDVEDKDAAIAELEAIHTRFAAEHEREPHENACVRALRRFDAAVLSGNWTEVVSLFAPDFAVENRRKIVGFPLQRFEPDRVAALAERYRAEGAILDSRVVLATRGERLALTRAVVGSVSGRPDAPRDELLHLVQLDESGLIAFQIWFGVDDLDAAMAELDRLHARIDARSTRAPLENGASRVDEQSTALARDQRWDEFGALLADDIRVQDRRRGFRSEGSGRAAVLREARAIAELGARKVKAQVVAIRGERLALVRLVFSGADETYQTELLRLVEVDVENRIAAHVVFDSDDMDSAVTELDARYVAGEAAAYAATWTVILDGHAALNRREVPPVASDCVTVDHRAGAAFAPGELVDYVRAGIELGQDVRTYIEAVHRLTELGAVYTHVGHGTSEQGFDAEWRGVDLVTVDGDLVSRCEIFDEADLDAALAKFDGLNRPTLRLENTASQVDQCFWSCFPAHDWDAMATMLSADFSLDDRRQAVNAGVRQGRDAEIENLKVIADLLDDGTLTSTTIATRGKRLALRRLRFQGPEATVTELIGVVEIDADNQLSVHITFDPDDIDAAFAELEARYLAGEAAPYTHIWQIGMATLDELNRHEPGPMIARLAYSDHRRVPFASGDFERGVTELWALVPDARYRTTAVHALDEHGAVVDFVIEGTDVHGNELQWTRVLLLSVRGGEPRLDVYEDDDLDSALAHFAELHRPVPQLENATSRVVERYMAHFGTREWDAMAELLAEDVWTHDRRRVVNSGVRSGRDAELANVRAIAEIGCTNITSTPIATRGDRLMLARHTFTLRDWNEPFDSELIDVVETNALGQLVRQVAFDAHDLEAALAELEARYLAGEGAPHSRTWSVVSKGYKAFSRRELPPMTPDCVSIDHRRGIAFAPGEWVQYTRAGWEVGHDIRIYPEAIHRLNDDGAVVTHVGHGNSPQGFDAEWRGVFLVTVSGDLINRFELFEEADLATATAKFDQLSQPAQRLENSASRVLKRWTNHFLARDWDAMSKMLADDYRADDHRRVINSGVRSGRAAEIANMQAIAEVGCARITSTPIAVRGERLVLSRDNFTVPDEAVANELVDVVEIGSDDRIVAIVSYDVDDIDAAFAELDRRYLAGEAAPHARLWSVMTRAYEVLNNRGLPATTPNWVNIDHRRSAAFAPGELTAYISAAWTDLEQHVDVRIEAVHRLSDAGAVLTQVLKGTTEEGFTAEWRTIMLYTVDGDLISRCELFEETDLDTAVAQFEQLSHPAPRLANSASRVYEQFMASFAARDWNAIAQSVVDNVCTDDRRRVVNSGAVRGRDAAIENLQALAELGVTNMTTEVIATRGERLALCRVGASAYETEVLNVVEVDADQRIIAVVGLDAGDIDAAFEELDRRYLAGEAAPHAETWSLVMEGHAAFNRRELPSIAPEILDHRPLVTVDSGDPTATIRDMWGFTPDLKLYIEAVHELTSRGAVFTQVSHGTSQAGFGAEWRIVELVTVDGDHVSRGELFEEADLVTALARFKELSPATPRLDNAAIRVTQLILERFAAREWDAMAAMVAVDVINDDRRRLLNADVQVGRDLFIENYRAAADLGVTQVSVAIATRGDRLVLNRARFVRSDGDPEEFGLELLHVIEIDNDNRVSPAITFDPDDIDAAFDELEARYLAGEAAANARTWSVITQTYDSFNRHEPYPTAPNWVNVDHRRLAKSQIQTDDLAAYLRAVWDVTPNVRIYIEMVHRLTHLGAVVSHAVAGTSTAGFDAERRHIEVLTVTGDLIDRCELFDDDDLATALARFEELHEQTRRLENTASRVCERVLTCAAARDWDAMADYLAADYSSDDRRRVANAGVRQGRDAELENFRNATDLLTPGVPVVIATRGERLALSRIPSSASDSEPFGMEMLCVVETNANARIVGTVVFHLDDVDAAFAELDARYLAGEAATHARTWSLVMDGYAKLNRRELPATTHDWVDVDHRRLVSVEGGSLGPSIRAVWNLTPEATIYVEAVHNLSRLGAVVTHAVQATSETGFDAEWREVSLLTFQDGLISRCEMFDETDLDAALARFDELQPLTRRVENGASETWEKFQTHFAARDWDTLSEMLADDIFNSDRRRVVNAGTREGRDATLASMRSYPEGTRVESAVVATRGTNLVLTRERYYALYQEAEEFLAEVLGIIEIDVHQRIAGRVAFDFDDLDAAFEELDARFLAGEAAPYAHMWSLVCGCCDALNRHEIPPTTPNWASMDHRRGITFAPNELGQYIRATFEIAPDIKVRVAAVHRLTDRGSVITHMAYGSSQEGFSGEWRETFILMFDGELLSCCERFGEEDVDAALARFEELDRPTPRLENAASRVDLRFQESFTARDWGTMGELLGEDICADDRRRVVSAGVRRGREAKLADMRATADLGTKSGTSTVIAIRGKRLALARICLSGRDRRPDAFHTEMLGITEINADNRMAARILFDPDDVDAAFEELDARYLSGEAAAYANAWSLTARAIAAFNRHELPEFRPNWVNIDHRRARGFAPGDHAAYIHATWDLAPDVNVYIEALHRLSAVGALFTYVLRGSSQGGFNAEWREIGLVTVEGQLINRFELFDESDLDAALARFDELQPQQPRLQNAASQVNDRYLKRQTARDWDAAAKILADDYYTDDRRRMVGGGIHGRDTEIANGRAATALGVTDATSDAIAVRGERLMLTRVRYWGRDQRQELLTAILAVIELKADDRIAAAIVFDPDDVDAAFEELESRYRAGGAAAQTHTWAVLAGAYAALNRHELPSTTRDWATVDRRRLGVMNEGDTAAFMRTWWDQAPDIKIFIQAVHRLNNLGAVITTAAHGTTQDGLAAEWRDVAILMVQGDQLSRCELFDEADLDTALARFDELNHQVQQPDNTAIRAWARVVDAINRRNVDAFLAEAAPNARYEDRRKLLRNEGLAEPEVVRGVFDMAAGWRLETEPVAVRGDHLSLTRETYRDTSDPEHPITLENLTLYEICDDNIGRYMVLFEPDDINGAFAELTSRWIASGEVTHPEPVQSVQRVTEAVNRHDWDAYSSLTSGAAYLSHRQLSSSNILTAADQVSSMQAMVSLVPNLWIEQTDILAQSARGLVSQAMLRGTTTDGSNVEVPVVQISLFDRGHCTRMEAFDPDQRDAALARFDELNHQVPQLENAAIRAWARVVDAINRRHIDDFLAQAAPGARFEDRRRGLRDEQFARPEAVRALFEMTKGWHLTTEPVAIRGSRLALIRNTWRDTSDPERAVTMELLAFYEVGDNSIGSYMVLFDPEDINGAFAELTSRWIASEEVEHPGVIEAATRHAEAVNRHDWQAYDEATRDATYVNHRQLPAGGNSIADHRASTRMMATLIPDIRFEFAEVLAATPLGVLGHIAMKGTSAEGAAVEIGVLNLLLLDGDRITRIETFDEDQRDEALARFRDLNGT
nr:BTAD domain-containing putative transcriptional regulator [Mycobacterium sp. 1274761.0]